jgi:FKBP-type peptidyl-prolyl cis-trans isomerase 2
MTQAKDGDTVRVHYTGTLADGSQFDSSRDRDPMEFTLGNGDLIPGFEEATIGMSVNDTIVVTIPADQAYGANDPEMVQEISREDLPEDIPLELGLRLQAEAPDGSAVLVTVTDLTDDVVILDGNHPLAGKDLTFEIELVEIV